MAHPYRTWLKKHLTEATAEYKRIQALEEEGEAEDEDMYDRVHQMWGYLSGLEKCLKRWDEMALAEKGR